MHARGAQLLLPEGLSAAATADTLAEHLPVVTQRAHHLERTFWDTFDGRVHADGLALIDSGGRLVLADAATYAEQAAGDHPRGAERLLAGDLPAGALRERLEPLVEMRALTPIARVHSRMLPLNVLDDEGKTVVRLRVEEPTVRSATPSVSLRARLHVAGVRGYDGAFERARALLTGELGLAEAPRPLHDEAVAVSGGTPGGTPSKLRVTLAAGQRADAAAVTVLQQLLATIEANLPGTLADVDSEFLHDLRVAVRRTRAMQRELAGVFPPRQLRAFRDEFRTLQQLTGPTRDLDVQLLEFDELAGALAPALAPDVEPLRELLRRHRATERRRMVRALRSARTRHLLDDWADFLEGLVEDGGERPDGARPVADVAGERIAKVYGRMVKRGMAIGDASPHEELHALRKQGKELRYLLEFFASLFPSRVVKPMVSSLKALQDVLGRFQDREVQAELLRSLAGEIVELERGPAALMAMGVLVERLGEQQAAARAHFAERFAAFASGSQRALVKQTFA